MDGLILRILPHASESVRQSYYICSAIAVKASNVHFCNDEDVPELVCTSEPCDSLHIDTCTAG